MSTQSRQTVLITRPERQGRAFAEAVEAARAGLFSFEFSPLLEIEILNAPVDLSKTDQLLFTSINGVRAYLANSDRRDVPAACAGEATAQFARAQGLAAEYLGPTSAALAKSLVAEPAKPRFLHITGRHQTHDLAARLSANGHHANTLVLYDQVARDLTPSACQMLQNGQITCVTLFSTRTAKLFAEAVRTCKPQPSLGFLCMSAGISDPIAQLFSNIRIADNPTQDAMVAAL